MDTAQMHILEAIRAKCEQEHWFGPYFSGPNYRMRVRDDDPNRAGFVFPPASDEQVQATETRIGVSLPPLLKALYTKLANGGFGPGGGFWGLIGGYGSVESATHTYDTETLVDRYTWKGNTHRFATKELAQYAKAGDYRERISKFIPYGTWWRELFPFCDLGCCQEICVDSQERMFVTAPVEDDSVYWLCQMPWTLEEWLWRWVRDEELVERYPSKAA